MNLKKKKLLGISGAIELEWGMEGEGVDLPGCGKATYQKILSTKEAERVHEKYWSKQCHPPLTPLRLLMLGPT